MQLKARDGAAVADIAARLASRSRALVAAGGGVVVAAAGTVSFAADPPGPGADWSVDASFVNYAESDERVTVNKSLANLARETDSGTLTVGLVHDAMSGASPSGALRGDGETVTYAGPSGGGFDTAAGADGSLAGFEDERVQASAGYEQELSSRYTLGYGGVVSQESDYDSLGANVSLARESADKATTADIGLALTSDTIYRSDTGGTPEPLAPTEEGVNFGDGTRNTTDVSFGLSRVLNRRTVARAMLQLGQSSGYHTDPYKVLSVADADGRVLENRYESRPDERTRTSLGLTLAHTLPERPHSVHLGYRFYSDDWGVASHTLDARYRHRLTKRQYLEPHVRFYAQGAADFYTPFLEADAGLGAQLPQTGFASADYRLDGVTSTTFGLKYGIALTPELDLRVRAEMLSQSFDTAEYDSLGATIVQTSLAWRF